MLITEVSRPVAFAVISGVAAVSCAILIVITETRHLVDPVSGARVATIMLGSDGQGRLDETYAFYGRNIPDFQLQGDDRNMVAQPVDFDPKDPPTLTSEPFIALDAGVHAESVRRIWQASSVYSAGQSIELQGVFDANGFTIHSKSELPGSLRSPLLIWGSSLLSIADLPIGDDTFIVSSADLNPPDIFTHGGGLVGQNDRLRGILIRGTLSSAQDEFGNKSAAAPMIVGWLDLSSVPPLLKAYNASSLLMNGEIMVRVPVQLAPSPIGSLVRIEGSFNQLGRLAGVPPLPTDLNGVATSTSTGAWIVKVLPPWQIGKLKPLRATISMDLDAPLHVVEVQADQFNRTPLSHKRVMNASAPALAIWSRPLGRRTVSFQVRPADLSADGSLVLCVKVDSASGGTAVSSQSPWVMSDFRVALDAQVVGGPAEPAPSVELDSSENSPPAMPKARTSVQPIRN